MEAAVSSIETNLGLSGFFSKKIVDASDHIAETTSLHEISNALAEINQWIPRLNKDEIEKLIRNFRKTLPDASQLRQEQAQLATTFGDWYSEHSFLKHAMHYYSIALNIEETQERHEKASSVFIRWISRKSIYQELLDHAYYRLGDPDQFNSVLHKMQALKSLCVTQNDVDALFAPAYECLSGAEENRVERFAECRKTIRSVNLSLSQFQSVSIKYRLALRKYRRQFKCLNPTEALAHFKELFNVFLQDAFVFLGSPPCGYDLRAVGSLAKKSPCPYSDLEWFILIEDEKHRDYFRNLAKIIELQIISLGETPDGEVLVFSVLGPMHRSGLRIDSGGNPARKSNTADPIAEPEKLSRAVSKDNGNMNDGFGTSLLQSVSLHSNNPRLHESFQGGISQEVREGKALAAIGSRKVLYESTWTADPEQLEEFKIKDEFILLLNFLISDFGLYFGLEFISPEEILFELKKRTIFDDIELIEYALNRLYKMRINLHLQAEEQKDVVSVAGLARSDWSFLCMTFRFILKPLYESIDLICKGCAVNLFSKALKCNPEKKLIPLMSAFVQGFRKQSLSESACKGYLIQMESSGIRSAYLKALEEHMIDVTGLAQIPARDGFRYAQIQDAKSLELALRQITTQIPTDVKITTPSLGKVYLKSEVAREILSGGNIRGRYDNCRHAVARLERPYLHFKQKPNHPLQEYAIHALTYRIMGRATPATELVRFEAEGQAYPVLISRTIIGSTLSGVTLGKINREHLTWMLLCAILTRPGDGRASNYILDPHGKIYCIDNDISFVEPIISGYLYEEIKFSSLLFRLDSSPLNPKVIQKFIQLDPERILTAWIEDLIEKEEEYARLFSDSERKQLYEEDPNNRFTPSLLFREGTISTLCLQFIHLQQFLKSRQVLSAQELLEAIITLRNDASKSVIGPRIVKRYKEGLFQPDLKKRLEIASQKQIEQSMTTPEIMQATFGKVPTTDEIEQRQLYSLQKAKEELSLCIVHRYLNTEDTTMVQRGNKRTLHAHFERMQADGVPDLSRQELVLNGLQTLIELGHFPNPEEIILSNCAVLTDAKLLPFLSESIRYLDLRHCPQLTSISIEEIAKRCPNLKELYVSGTKINAIAAYGRVSWYILYFPNLQILHCTRCEKLDIIMMRAPMLKKLKADSCPKLSHVDIGVAIYYSETSFEHCPSCRIERNRGLQEVFGRQGLKKIQKALADNPPAKLFLSGKIREEGAKVLAGMLLKNRLVLSALTLIRPEILPEGAKALADAIENNQALSSFELVDNTIKEEGREALALAFKKNQMLTALSLRDFNIGLRAGAFFSGALANSLSILSFSIRAYDSSEIGSMRMLAAGLEKNRSLLEFALENNGIDDHIAIAFAEALRNHSRLCHFSLDSNQIGNRGALAIAHALKIQFTHPSPHLILRIGLTGDARHEEIREKYDDRILASFDSLSLDSRMKAKLALQSHRRTKMGNLFYLHLSGNQIGNEGVISLAELLQLNGLQKQTLYSLDLSHNQIGDEGVVALARKLQNNRTISCLDLSYNQIGDEGAKALAEALKDHCYLFTLNLSNNKIGVDGGKALLEALMKNSNLSYLSLKSNLFSSYVFFPFWHASLVNLCEVKKIQEIINIEGIDRILWS